MQNNYPNNPLSLEGEPLEVAPVEEADEMPEFPDDAFYGNFEHLYSAYWGTNETCKPYLFAQGLATVSTLIGRQATFAISKDTENTKYKIYPNTFQTLVGETSEARKSTCRSNMISDIKKADTTEEIVFEVAVGSAEALIHSLRNDGKDESPEWNEGDFPEGIRFMLHLDELRILLMNSRRSGTTTIVPKITELYGCPEYASTKSVSKGKIECHYPTMNIFACTTQEWLEKSVFADDIEGGFINRFMFWNYSEVDDIPFPLSPNQEHLDKWINSLQYMRSQDRFRTFIFSEPAAKSYEEMYFEYRTAQRKTQDTLLKNTIARKMDHIFKIALLYSLVTNDGDDDKISLDSWTTACGVAEYLASSSYLTFKDVGTDPKGKNEQDVLKALNQLGNRATRRDISRKIGARYINSQVLNPIIDNLIGTGIVAEEQLGKRTMVVKLK